MVDFHSHFPSNNSFLCSADGSIPDGDALVRFVGLLPSFWTLEKEKDYLDLLRTKTYEIGEIGLDKRFLCNCNLDKQKQLLANCLTLGSSTDRIVALHCVNETGEMIGMLKNCISMRSKVIWHGFNGSMETASILSKMNIITSIRPSFRGDVRALFKANPKTVLETDYEGTDEKEYNSILERHYENISAQIGITIRELEEHCNELSEAITNKQIHR